jgi:hypothetical protein
VALAPDVPYMGKNDVVSIFWMDHWLTPICFANFHVDVCGLPSWPSSIIVPSQVTGMGLPLKGWLWILLVWVFKFICNSILGKLMPSTHQYQFHFLFNSKWLLYFHI